MICREPIENGQVNILIVPAQCWAPGPRQGRAAGDAVAGRKQQEPRRHDEAVDTSPAETAKLYREWAQVEAMARPRATSCSLPRSPMTPSFWSSCLRSSRPRANRTCLPQPLALIEVGASAGLCLLYDSWRYHYTGSRVDRWVGPTKSPLTLSCFTTGDVPVPQEVPAIVWLAGLDLNPIDAADPDARRWLQALIWPEHHERNAFITLLAESGVHRLGAEGTCVLPHLTRQILDDVEINGRFVVSLDDRALAMASHTGGP